MVPTGTDNGSLSLTTDHSIWTDAMNLIKRIGWVGFLLAFLSVGTGRYRGLSNDRGSLPKAQ